MVRGGGLGSGRVGLVEHLKVGVQVDPLRELKPETRRGGGEGGRGVEGEGECGQGRGAGEWPGRPC